MLGGVVDEVQLAGVGEEGDGVGGYGAADCERDCFLLVLAAPVASAGTFFARSGRWGLHLLGGVVVEDIVDPHVASWRKGVDRLEAMADGRCW